VSIELYKFPPASLWRASLW